VRVLFSAHGAYGHLLPVVGVARALRDAGHQVRVAIGREFHADVGALGLDPVHAGMSDAALVAETTRRWPETSREPPARWAVRMFTDIAAPAMASDLSRLFRSWRPDLIVREEGEYGAPHAASAAGIPWVTHGWGSPLAPVHSERPYGAALLDSCPPSLQSAAPANPPRRSVRPVPVELRAPPAGWQPPQPPFAYIGFGTVPLYRDRPKQLLAVVRAVLRSGLDAVVTTPDRRLAAELQRLDDRRVSVEDWMSLARLLPSCQLVVSHGGAGTALASLAAGVPLLLLPQGAPSQLRMSHACAERGVARVVEPQEAAFAPLEAVLAEVLADEQIRAAAAELALEIAEMPGPDEAVPFLEDLMNRTSSAAPG
jgi:UDP:flavonoid glycosyltransferase YjiC (YdhE family)